MSPLKPADATDTRLGGLLSGNIPMDHLPDVFTNPIGRSTFNVSAHVRKGLEQVAEIMGPYEVQKIALLAKAKLDKARKTVERQGVMDEINGVLFEVRERVIIAVDSQLPYAKLSLGDTLLPHGKTPDMLQDREKGWYKILINPEMDPVTFGKAFREICEVYITKTDDDPTKPSTRMRDIQDSTRLSKWDLRTAIDGGSPLLGKRVYNAITLWAVPELFKRGLKDEHRDHS